MDDTDSNEVAKEVDEELTRVVRSLVAPAAPIGQRRFRFAVGMLCLAPFCVTVAFFPWPNPTFLDQLMWVGYALVLLFIGAWQLDKSNKESDDADPDGGHPTSIGEGSSSNVLSLQRRP